MACACSEGRFLLYCVDWEHVFLELHYPACLNSSGFLFFSLFLLLHRSASTCWPLKTLKLCSARAIYCTNTVIFFDGMSKCTSDKGKRSKNHKPNAHALYDVFHERQTETEPSSENLKIDQSPASQFPVDTLLQNTPASSEWGQKPEAAPRITGEKQLLQGDQSNVCRLRGCRQLMLQIYSFLHSLQSWTLV